MRKTGFVNLQQNADPSSSNSIKHKEVVVDEMLGSKPEVTNTLKTCKYRVVMSYKIPSSWPVSSIALWMEEAHCLCLSTAFSRSCHLHNFHRPQGKVCHLVSTFPLHPSWFLILFGNARKKPVPCSPPSRKASRKLFSATAQLRDRSFYQAKMICPSQQQRVCLNE